jgi:hypothetical protein
MVQRHQYFKPLLSVVEALCQPATESFLAGNAAAGEQESAAAAAGSSSKAGKQQQQQQQQAGRVVSIAGAVRGIQKGASIVKKQLTKALQAAPTGNSSRVDKQAGGRGLKGMLPDGHCATAWRGVAVSQGSTGRRLCSCEAGSYV